MGFALRSKSSRRSHPNAWYHKTLYIDDGTLACRMLLLEATRLRERVHFLVSSFEKQVGRLGTSLKTDRLQLAGFVVSSPTRLACLKHTRSSKLNERQVQQFAVRHQRQSIWKGTNPPDLVYRHGNVVRTGAIRSSQHLTDSRTESIIPCSTLQM